MTASGAADHPERLLPITRFYLYFATRHSAIRSVELLETRGFKAETGLGWDDPFWVTVASREIPNDEIDRVQEEMEELAKSLEGDCGGHDQRPSLPTPG